MDVLHHRVRRHRRGEGYKSESPGPASLPITHDDLQAPEGALRLAVGLAQLGDPHAAGLPLPQCCHTWRSGRGVFLQAGCAALSPRREKPAGGPKQRSPSVVSQLNPPRKSLALGLQQERLARVRSLSQGLSPSKVFTHRGLPSSGPPESLIAAIKTKANCWELRPNWRPGFPMLPQFRLSHRL